MNLNIFHNKALLINIVVVASVLIVIIILNTPTTIDYEELATVPYDYTPNPFIAEWIPKQISVDIKYPQLFIVEHATYTVTTPITIPMLNHTITTEYQPYPMSPATSILICDSIHPNDTILILAVKKMDTTPAIYAVAVNDIIRCYFSDPFPTGYNSIVVFIRIDTSADNLKVKISKVRELG